MATRRKHEKRIGGQPPGSGKPLRTAVTNLREKRQRQDLERKLRAKSTSELHGLAVDSSPDGIGSIARQLLQERTKLAEEKEKLSRSLRELGAAAPAMSIFELERFAASSSGPLSQEAQALLLQKCRKQVATLTRGELSRLALESANSTLHTEARRLWLENDSEALSDLRSFDIEELEQLRHRQIDPRLRSLLGTAIQEMKTTEEDRIRAIYSSQSIEQLRAAVATGCAAMTRSVLLRLISEKEADDRRRQDQLRRPPKRVVERRQTRGQIGFEERLPRVWVIKCTEWPRDGSHGWHWRNYLSAPDVYNPSEPAEDWGGKDWIRSPYSMKLLRDEVSRGDLALCYQSDDEHHGRAILALTQFASDGKQDPPGSGRCNCFDMIPPEHAFRLEPPLTIEALYENGCHPKCFGPGSQGTVFPVELRDLEGILEAIGRQSAAQKKALQEWLRNVCRGLTVSVPPVAKHRPTPCPKNRNLPTKGQTQSPRTPIVTTVTKATQNTMTVHVCGVEIPALMIAMAHGRKYQEASCWILTSKRGVRIAAFTTEPELDNWWKAFQESQGRKPETLAVGKLSQLSKPTGRAKRPEYGRTFSDASKGDYLRPWSTKYDMPEYDLE